jgi:hypothetical protein
MYDLFLYSPLEEYHLNNHFSDIGILTAEFQALFMEQTVLQNLR